MTTSDAVRDANALLTFIDACPTAFQAADAIADLLEGDGFSELDEGDHWSLAPGNRYYIRRNQSAIIAFCTGATPAAEAGFRIAAAHTDSPALKLKMASEQTQAGCTRIGIEIYGGPILSTWLDRPLGIAGRVMVRRDKEWQPCTCRLARPCAVVPNLALHLNRDVNKGFEYNAQTHLQAVLAGTTERPDHGLLRAALAEALKTTPEDIGAADLFLYDAQPGCITGLRQDLVNAPRIDNLAMCHAILMAFLKAPTTDATSVAMFYDNEEVGSRALQAADSSFARDILTRIVHGAGGGNDDLYRACARSFMVSADAAHAHHPNFPDKHDTAYAPVLNGGPCIKSSAAIRYTTSAPTAARFENLCAAAGVTPQWFVNRSDIRSGSTIGPPSSALLSIPGVDVGTPILAMHSIRETAGVHDHAAMIAVLARLFGD